MIGQLNSLYELKCETCGGSIYEDLADDTDWDSIYNQIAEDLLNNKDYQVNIDLHLVTAKKLSEAIDKGLKPTREDELKLVATLKKSIYPFSAAKSFQQMLYYRQMMVEDGSIISKDKFIKKIVDTGEIFNKKHLSSEFENAYYSSIMADKWDRLDADVLQYSTAGDSRVRPSHQALDKFTAPKTDPFWKNNYPPNGWGCRCIAVPGKDNYKNTLTPREAGNMLKEENRNTPFYNNVGISKVIFNEKHPYFYGVNKKLSNLSWEQYGLPTLEKMRVGELATYKTSTKEDYINWWTQQPKIKNDDILITDCIGQPVVLDSIEGNSGNKYSFFKDHILKKENDRRFEYALEIPNILKFPDEIWLNPKDKETKVYLKMYERGVLKMVVNKDNVAETLYFIEQDDSFIKNKVGEARKGVLMYRK
ncbi:phage minor head protein [Riemerella anatipestifer]|uniref:phage minor head protein n=1 Tax=Riemerella anatipestifer TaxID=34085 RepID=UPI0013736220|nr:phage minor head protein [Riemerella anatipestifer]MBT0550234.1 minor capsid protein [Riemerella anatipestifer]MBT0556958.1 minor capsid protein [Riemerella anatipestifer]MBT0560994.1 minor capsid protein [Riemerella anatipestifer]NAV17335.1 hypothetical protein [Riemerella anatipestifer]